MGFFARDLEAAARPAGAVEWEECPCPLCDGGDWTPLVEAPDRQPGGKGLWFVVVQCRDCGLCFTNPRPSRRTIAQFYPFGYGPHQPKKKRLRWFRHCISRWCGNVRKVLPVHGEGRLLDFGCGGGSYLVRTHGQGWQVTGVDVVHPTLADGDRRSGLRTITGTLPHLDLGETSFDVITMWQSLEHVHAPTEVLREARRLLAPHGKLIIAVPNIDSLPFRWFGQAWYGLDLPRHLTHFAPWTLRLMLHRAGFRPGRVRLVRHASWLRASARLASQRPQATRWLRWLRGRASSSLATWYTFLTRQSDCMMITARKR